MGAAILAASLQKRDDLKPFMVRNVIPLSIGLLSKDYVVRKVVKRNTVYPIEIKCKGRTMFDNQQAMFISIYEGEHAKAAYNRKLGSMSLEGLHIAAAGNPIKIAEQISITVQYLVIISGNQCIYS